MTGNCAQSIRLILFTLWVGACGRHGTSAEQAQASARTTASAARPTSRHNTEYALHDPHAYIPAQCYTKTKDDAGHVHNPCYTCHSPSRAPNFVDDSAQQLLYSLPGDARTNPFTNLFVDRRADIAAITDAEISSWVRTSNLSSSAHLETLIPDRTGSVTDAYFQFDAQGFDHAPDGRYSGWRAFAYYPFPGAFMPTNGSTDDVLVRLPPPFRNAASGAPDLAVYALNLAILEAIVKQEDVPIPATDERTFGVDLDGDGRIARAARVHFRFDRAGKTTLSWVGAARAELAAGRTQLAPGSYPEGSELLHSVRYLDVAPDGSVNLAARLKELRYARKLAYLDDSASEQVALAEVQERKLQPDVYRALSIDAVKGAYTHLGWRYHALIENADGSLRAQTRDELAACVGCHTGLGVTTDGTFALARKLPSTAFQGGWYHWSQHRLAHLPEPKRADGHAEYAEYLTQNGAGDELRANDEIMARFFDARGEPLPARLAELSRDIAVLLWPSAPRALALDKAYRLLVREQSFERGRDVTLAPAVNVHHEVTRGEPTGVSTPLRARWERRVTP